MTSKNSNYPNDLLKTEHFSSPIEPLVICLKPLLIALTGTVIKGKSKGKLPNDLKKLKLLQ